MGTVAAAEREARRQLNSSRDPTSAEETLASMGETLYTCRKCKSRKVHVVTAQTRSADEPMTEFCTCFACGCRWKN